MITLANTLEGFKLLIGGFIQNLALPLAMWITIRFPSYEDDEDRTTEAFWTMITLTVYHFLLSHIRYYSFYKGDFWRNSIGIIVITVVSINI